MTKGSGIADLARILRDFRSNPPADAQIIERCEQELGVVLPDAYKRFLQHANGGEGPIGPASYAQLWSVGDLADNNDGYEVNQYAPGIVLFGSNGGGEAFFRLSSRAAGHLDTVHIRTRIRSGSRF